jgi:hypothetical protein
LTSCALSAAALAGFETISAAPAQIRAAVQALPIDLMIDERSVALAAQATGPREPQRAMAILPMLARSLWRDVREAKAAVRR